MYDQKEINDKTKWLMRVEAARYIGVSVATFGQLEESEYLVKDAREFVHLAFQHEGKGSGAHRDWGYRYNKEKLDRYLARQVR